MEIQKKYFSLDETAMYLNLSKSCIYKKTCKNLIPVIKVGKKLLFKQEELDEWVESYSQPTKTEISNNISNLLKPRKNGKQ